MQTLAPYSRRALLAAAAAFAGAALVAIPARAAEKDNFVIAPGRSFGPIKKGTTLAQLERLYGKANIRVRTVQPPHGDFQKQRAAVIFPGTKDEAVAFLKERTSRVERVVIEKAGGRWRSQEGLRVGTTLAELEKILGGPFPITPYGQDGGGAVGEVRNNALARHLYIRLTYGEKQLPAADEKVMFGEKPFRSDHPAARRAGLTVSVIWWDVER